MVQLLFVVGGIGLGLITTKIRSGALITENRSDDILGAVGFGIIGLVSVIYSLLFLVVQSSNTTFSPRLNLFQDDPWIWRTYAIALGLFAYSMTALLAGGASNTVSVAVPILAFAMALVVIGLIRRILMSAFASLQLSTVIDRLSKSGRVVIELLYPQALSAPDRVVDAHTESAQVGRPVQWAAPSATLQQLDLDRLMATAERTSSMIDVHVRVGSTLWEGATIATVYGDLPMDTVLASFVTGLDRTFDQDPLLAFRLLSDIGLRALSPAVNDPATAAQTLDAAVGLLMLLGSRNLSIDSLVSSDGTTRVRLSLPTWSDFLREGVDDVLAAAGHSPLMTRHAVAVLRELAERVPPTRRPGIEDRLHALLH